MRRALAVAAALTLSACAQPVDGDPRASDAAVHLLPTDDEITDAVGNGLSSFDFQAFVGGPEILPDGFRTDEQASPIRCIGVTDTATRVTYEATPMLEAARQSYFTLAERAAVSGADAAVIRMGSAQDAQRVFDGFVDRWRGCDGATVTKHLSRDAAEDVAVKVTDVASTDSVLSAALETMPGAGGTSSHYQRVVARRSDTLVEVSLAVGPTGERNASAATALARVMLDKA